MKYIILFPAVLSIIFTILSLLDRFYLFFEYFCHFRPQYLIIQIICLSLIFKDKNKFKYILSIFLIINLLPLLYLYIPVNKRDVKNKFRIYLSNVHMNNHSYNRLLSSVEKESPDIIVLVEVDKKWVNNVNSLEKIYMSYKMPRKDCFGIVVYSKFPIISSKIEYHSSYKYPSLWLKLNIDGRFVNLIAIHAMAPNSKMCIYQRNEELSDLGSMFANMKGQDIILLGDFNDTSLTYTFNELLNKSGLTDSRRGFGLQPTWPVYFFPALIPIDHCLTGGNIVILNRRVGNDIGSDHYPVILDMGL